MSTYPSQYLTFEHCTMYIKFIFTICKQTKCTNRQRYSASRSPVASRDNRPFPDLPFCNLIVLLHNKGLHYWVFVSPSLSFTTHHHPSLFFGKYSQKVCLVVGWQQCVKVGSNSLRFGIVQMQGDYSLQKFVVTRLSYFGVKTLQLWLGCLNFLAQVDTLGSKTLQLLLLWSQTLQLCLGRLNFLGDFVLIFW